MSRAVNLNNIIDDIDKISRRVHLVFTIINPYNFYKSQWFNREIYGTINVRKTNKSY